jgi:hypothetical protein
MNYARQPDGLSARIERDRGAERVPLKHGRTARIFFTLGNVFTFGRYIHRETATPELSERMELARRVSYHTQFLSEVAKSSPQTDVAWDVSMVRQSLQFLADDGSTAGKDAARAAGAIFEKTNDDETRRLSLDALSTINSQAARKELLRLFQLQPAQSELRADIAARCDGPYRKTIESTPKKRSCCLVSSANSKKPLAISSFQFSIFMSMRKSRRPTMQNENCAVVHCKQEVRRPAPAIGQVPPARSGCCSALLDGPSSQAQTKRVVILKVDGLPYDMVDRFVQERDPLTGKSRLPWFDYIFIPTVRASRTLRSRNEPARRRHGRWSIPASICKSRAMSSSIATSCTPTIT